MVDMLHVISVISGLPIQCARCLVGELGNDLGLAGTPFKHPAAGRLEQYRAQSLPACPVGNRQEPDVGRAANLGQSHHANDLFTIVERRCDQNHIGDLMACAPLDPFLVQGSEPTGG